MSKPLPPVLHSLIGKISNEFNQDMLSGFLAALRAEDVMLAGKWLDRSNRRTRRECWVGSNKDDTIPPHALRALILENGIEQDPPTQCWLLNVCLERGWVDEALDMLDQGNPSQTLPQWGETYDSRLDPLARMMYGEYPLIPQDQTSKVASALLDHGPIPRFNAGCIASHEALLEFLKRAPDPEDEQAWKPMLWDVRSICLTQVRSETDPRNVIKLLEKGYPGVPIDLIVRALIAGNHEHAAMLLDWAGPDVAVHPRKGLVSSFDITTEEPVLAAGFWHALAEKWATSVSACLINQWDPADLTNVWPNDALLDKLLQCRGMDPTGLDPEGRTPAQLAMHICGEAGPFEELGARHQALMLQHATQSSEGLGPMRHRL